MPPGYKSVCAAVAAVLWIFTCGALASEGHAVDTLMDGAYALADAYTRDTEPMLIKLRGRDLLHGCHFRRCAVTRKKSCPDIRISVPVPGSPLVSENVIVGSMTTPRGCAPCRHGRTSPSSREMTSPLRIRRYTTSLSTHQIHALKLMAELWCIHTDLHAYMAMQGLWSRRCCLLCGVTQTKSGLWLC